jgi:Polyketide cyclase / dehydrase and lipid transport
VPPITVSAEIHRPADVVFAYATDPSRFPEWQKGVVSGHMESTGTPKVGDRCHTKRRIGFTDRPDTSELVRFDPPHRWGVRGLAGPIRAMVDVTVQALSETDANLTIALEFEGHGIGRLLVPMVVERQARREMPVNLASLKERLESAPQDGDSTQL